MGSGMYSYMAAHERVTERKVKYAPVFRNGVTQIGG